MTRRTSAPDDVLDAEIEPRGRAATAEFPDPDLDDGSGEEILQTDQLVSDTRIPLFRGVKVVYMGSNPHHAPTLRGRVLQEIVGGETVERSGPDGMRFRERVGGQLSEMARPGNSTNYEFRTHDAAGGRNPRRMAADHRIAIVRDRPYQTVQHAEHVYFFAIHKAGCDCNDKLCGGGYVLIHSDPQTKLAVQEYVLRRERARKARRSFLNQVAPERR